MGQFILNVLTSYLPFLILATMGIVLIFKTSSTTNFAQGMIGVFGAFLTSYLIDRVGVSDYTSSPSAVPNSFLHLVLCILGGMLLSFLIGLFIDGVIFRFSKYTNAATKQIITMGIVILFSGLIPIVFGETVTRRSFQFFGDGNTKLFGIQYTNHRLFTMILAITIISVIFILLKYTKWGLGVRSVASNEKVASLMGINPNVINGSSWAIAGALGALAAITYTAAINTLDIGSMTPIQIDAFYSSILGGFSTFAGPIFGAIILSIIQFVAVLILPAYGMGSLVNTFVYLFIIVVILIKPNGIFGKKVMKKV